MMHNIIILIPFILTLCSHAALSVSEYSIIHRITNIEKADKWQKTRLLIRETNPFTFVRALLQLLAWSSAVTQHNAGQRTATPLSRSGPGPNLFLGSHRPQATQEEGLTDVCCSVCRAAEGGGGLRGRGGVAEAIVCARAKWEKDWPVHEHAENT